jgi:hypothetical protein
MRARTRGCVPQEYHARATAGFAHRSQGCLGRRSATARDFIAAVGWRGDRVANDPGVRLLRLGVARSRARFVVSVWCYRDTWRRARAAAVATPTPRPGQRRPASTRVFAGGTQISLILVTFIGRGTRSRRASDRAPSSVWAVSAPCGQSSAREQCARGRSRGRHPNFRLPLRGEGPCGRECAPLGQSRGRAGSHLESSVHP